jgi:hypothetical protein
MNEQDRITQETDDTDGQSMKWSDATVKSDVVPVGDSETPDESDDTDGQSMKWSDATVKSDVVPVGDSETSDESDDTDGNTAVSKH